MEFIPDIADAWRRFDWIAYLSFASPDSFSREWPLQQEFARVGIHAQRFLNVRSPFDELAMQGIPHSRSMEHPNRLNITMGHLRMVKAAYESGAIQGLFMEDDPRFLLDLSPLPELVQSLPEDYDLALFDWVFPKKHTPMDVQQLLAAERVNGHWTRFTNLRSCACYALSRNGMKKYIHLIERSIKGRTKLKQSDQYWPDMVSEGMNCYCAFPHACVQGVPGGATDYTYMWNAYREIGVSRDLFTSEGGITVNETEPKDLTISMTTHGERVPLVTRILKPVVQQAKAVNARVVLTLHKSDVHRMTPELKDMLKEDVQLLIAQEDLGSNLKYIEAMRAFPNEPLIVHDDDVIFPEETFVEMMAFHKEHPDAIGCRRIRQMSWGAEAWPSHFNKDYAIRSAVDVTQYEEVKDAFPEGCKGIIFPAGCFLPLINDKTMLRDIREQCIHDDDVALRLLALRSNRKTYLIPCGGKLVDKDYYAAKEDPDYIDDEVIRKTALWGQGHRGLRTTNCLRHFARELWFYGRQ